MVAKCRALEVKESVGDSLKFNKAKLDAKYFGNKTPTTSVMARGVEVLRSIKELTLNLVNAGNAESIEASVVTVPKETAPVMHYATMQQKVVYITTRIVDTMKLRGVKIEPSVVRDYIWDHADAFAREEDERFIQMSLSTLREKGILT